MCGICGYIGYDVSFSHGYLAILKLLNRGYDSVGITTINKDNSFITHKYASDDQELADSKILKHQQEHNGSVSILHSRWRTVGDKTDANSHPHLDMNNTFSLVHNGIVENYLELKEFLIKNSYTFRSETDSEVIVNMISYYYKKKMPVLDAIKYALDDVHGTYALCILCVDTPDIMYCVRHGSPLLIGFPKDGKFAMVVSESYAFSNRVDEYFVIENNDIIVLKKENNVLHIEPCSNKLYESRSFAAKVESHSPDPYPHWTLKEINEQVISCVNAINMGGRIENESTVKLGGLNQHKNEILQNSDNLVLLACGTSYYAGMCATHLFKSICNFDTVQLFDGAEFAINDLPKSGKTCVIFISQSGETKDLHRCLEALKELDNTIVTIGVINVVDSLIAREVTCGVYLNCGREVAVASTKAFSSQVVVLSLIAMWFSQNSKNDDIIGKRKACIKKIMKLNNDISATIEKNLQVCKEIADYLVDKNSVFVLGKETMEPIAKEGSLKLKEIGYIHAEGYSSSALKHGPYALLTDGYPVILLTPFDKQYVRNQGILDELKSRGAYVIGISDTELSDKYNKKLMIPKDSYTEITSCIVLQLIAYYLSIKKGINPDFPKNLSKTVSVD